VRHKNVKGFDFLASCWYSTVEIIWTFIEVQFFQT
jgi:hypothetical protein